MSTLFDAVVLTVILALALSCLHSIMSPVIDEYNCIQQSQPRSVLCVVHSDGILDNEDVEELTFTKDDDTSMRCLYNSHLS